MKPNFKSRERTTKNADDYKVLVIGSVIAIIILIGSTFFDRLNEFRWYRNAVALTPFHSVVLNYSYVDEEANQITVGGLLTKRRCVFDDFDAYVYSSSGIRHRAIVNPSQEVALTGNSGSRPPSKTAETWGPWTVTVIDKTIEPVSWEIFVDHKKCPTFPVKQTNLFVSGLWVTSMFVVQEQPESTYPDYKD